MTNKTVTDRDAACEKYALFSSADCYYLQILLHHRRRRFRLFWLGFQ